MHYTTIALALFAATGLARTHRLKQMPWANAVSSFEDSEHEMYKICDRSCGPKERECQEGWDCYACCKEFGETKERNVIFKWYKA
ncbi:uncharacterized protein K452DRAFT_302013 [Aplosporella prunicola CBS 121167]|uniref:Uncharacterized protein n=1 Tax=Aplosporella prunicola CBS 121167 TaxID=1176127 RepID=A0A6A6B364_9PEZI|nr:uncharacterized protein K452DRAFT_302013 [Aplosporella prunicola CBS 121167]KAF2137437.1 hypothetical protein K452DRAFT_302013 [Aplosporella prunicola CBS 121167]